VNGNPSVTSGSIALNGKSIVAPRDWAHAHDAPRIGGETAHRAIHAHDPRARRGPDSPGGPDGAHGQGDPGGAGKGGSGGAQPPDGGHPPNNGAHESSLQASVALLVENRLTVTLTSKPGSAIRVRVFAAAP